ncbi:biotin/lipoyl-binding protein [Synechocystis sp. B12]|nr:biotin/lipoyl-binding protein [Synechocystis sp. B12]
MAMPLVQSMKKPLPVLLSLLGLGILVVGIFAYRSAYGPSRQSELDKYTVMATESPLEVEIKASGTVQPKQTVNISPKAPGRLVRLFVEQGDVVKKAIALR